MKFCPNCGAKVASGDVFCTNCGAKLTGSQVQADSTQNINQVSQKPQAVKPVRSAKPQPAARPAAKQASRKSGNWFKRHKAIVIVAAVVIIAVLGFAGFKHHQANSGVLANAEITYSGSNGNGQAHIPAKTMINSYKPILVAVSKESGLSDELIQKLEDAETAKDLYEADQAIQADHSQASEDFEKAGEPGGDSLTLEITPDENLKNGDKVTLKFKESDVVKKVEKKYGLDLSPKTYTVSGLQ